MIPALIKRGVEQILEGLGVDPTDHNFDRTPQRYAEVLAEIFRPPEVETPVFDEHYTDMVMMRGHEFYTLCPHHLLPVRLTASLAYIPDGKVIGASKLMRMMHDANRCPMTQEALTDAIVKRVAELTQNTSKGAAVFLEGDHGCFRIRGVKSREASLVTTRFSGEFETNLRLQDRFLSLAQR